MGTYDDLVREYHGAVSHTEACAVALGRLVRMFVNGYLKCPARIAKTVRVTAVVGREINEDYIMSEDGTLHALLQLSLGDNSVELQASVHAEEQGWWKIQLGSSNGRVTLNNETELAPIFDQAYQDLVAKARAKAWAAPPAPQNAPGHQEAHSQ